MVRSFRACIFPKGIPKNSPKWCVCVGCVGVVGFRVYGTTPIIYFLLIPKWPVRPIFNMIQISEINVK